MPKAPSIPPHTKKSHKTSSIQQKPQEPIKKKKGFFSEKVRFCIAFLRPKIPAAMWSTGGSKKLPAPSSSLVLLLVMLSVSHFCAFSHCRVGAIRVLLPSKETTDQAQTMKPNKINQEDLFQKYFNRTSASDVNTSTSRNSTQKGFQESKRTVPSCPDPLHN